MSHICSRCGSPMIDLGVDWVCSNVACDKQQTREAMEWAKATVGHAQAVGALRELTEAQRMEVFRLFCTHCGSDNPRCQCWNDE